MNRTSSILGLLSLASAAGLSNVAQAQNHGELQLLKSRVSALESRVAVLENNAAGTSVKPASWEKPTEPQQETYVIKEGDTIGSIARKLGVPRSELMEANALREGQQIYIGDPLVVPRKPALPDDTFRPEPYRPTPPPGSAKPPQPQNYTSYTVRYGDTLSSISRKYGVSVGAIKAANGLRSDAIGGGQRLKIPTGGAQHVHHTPTPQPGSQPPRGKQPTNPNFRPNESYGEYTVAKGDNLYALARDFFTTMKELQRLNQLGSSTLIYPGDKIIVPTSKYNEYHNKMASR